MNELSGHHKKSFFDSYTKEEKKALVATIVLHSVFLIVAGLGFMSCWEQPQPFVVPGEISVSFGNSSLGKGDNPKLADKPADKTIETPKNTEIQPIEEVTKPIASTQPTVSKSVTDPDSDLTPQKTEPKTTSKPTTNTVSTTPKSSATKSQTDSKSTKPAQTMGSGDTEAPGNQGKLTGETMGANSNGTSTAKGNGDSPEVDGWILKNKPDKPSITKRGTAMIKFKINSFGDIIYAKVISGPFSPSENMIIEEEFKKISFSKRTDINVPKKPFYEGLFEWKLEY